MYCSARMYHLGPIMALLCAEVGVFSRLLFADQNGVPYRMIPWDFRSAVAPWLIFAWDAIKAGIWPLWCPYVGAGTPFFINPQTQLYSPLSLFLGSLTGYSFRVAQFHSVALMFVGGVGAYFLAHALWRRRSAGLIAGLCFQLTSATYAHLEHGPILAAYALAPWFFWAILLVIERRSPWGVPVMAAVVYWILSAGYLGVVFLLFFWAAAFAVALAYRQPMLIANRLRLLARAALAALLGAGIAAVAWLPFAANFSELTRSQTLSLDYILDPGRSLPAKQFWGVLFPFLVNHPFPGVTGDVSMRGIYFGAAAVVLAVVCLLWMRGWMVGALATLAIGSLLMSLGSHFFLRIAIHVLAPVFNFSRFPSADSHYLTVLALSLLASGGAVLVAERLVPAVRTARLGFLILAVVYVVGFFLLPAVYGKTIDIVLSALTFEALCMLLALLVIARFRGTQAVLLLAGLVLLETGTAAIMNFEPAGSAVVEADYKALVANHVTTFTPAGTETPRGGNPDNAGDESPGTGYVTKKFFVNDYNPVRLKRFEALVAAGFLPWLKDGPRVAALPIGAPPADFATFKARLTDLPFKIEEFTPNQIRYRLTPANEVLAVFNEMYFPGWTATVDGAPVTVDAIATGLRAVRVGGGSHEVVFRFRPRVFFVALVISGLSLAIFFALAFRAWRRSRPGSPGAAPAVVAAESPLFFSARLEEI
jgi:hypothetical protein